MSTIAALGTSASVLGSGVVPWNPLKISSKVLFWGKVSEISGGQMPNKVTGATDFLTVAGSPYTFQTPNTAPYIAADTDYIWFKPNITQRTTTTAELIGYDLQRTPVKYLDDTPNTLQEIVILKSGEVLTAHERDHLFAYMHLPIMWDDSYNDFGYIKSNRPATEQVLWPGDLNAPTLLTLALIAGGVRVSFTDNSAGTAQHEIWGKIDSGAYALVTTLDAADVSYDDLRTPEDLMTYKIRAKRGIQYSDYCTEDDIAMLGANLVPAASSDFATDGSAWWTSISSVAWNSGTHDLTITQSSGRNYLYRLALTDTAKKYLVRFDIKGNDNTKIQVANYGGRFLTDITNLFVSATYQTFKFLGQYSIGTGLIGIERLGEASVTNKEFTIDNIKVQEVL